MSRGAFVCDNCHEFVRHLHDRWHISEDAMRADGQKRAYRIPLMNLCSTCMKDREQDMRPSGDPNQGVLL